MAKLSRKNLKKDHFAEEVSEGIGYIAAHRRTVLAGGIALIVAVMAVVGLVRYRTEANTKARQDFQAAMNIVHGVVSADEKTGFITFATNIEKAMRTEAALTKVSQDHAGRLEGEMARLYLAMSVLEEGNTGEGLEQLEALLNSPDSETASLARKGLADLLTSEKKYDEALKHYEYLVEHPTVTVPREITELYGLFDLYKATDEAKAVELLDGVIERDGAGVEMARGLRSGLSPASPPEG